jgi:predicted N-acetyltransferase YhbS
MIVRRATPDDVEACVSLIEDRRRQYETYQPRFWKKATASAEASSAWYEHLFAQQDAIALVADDHGSVIGFLIAVSFPAPPVYDPGGANALIDDFAVANELWNTIGHALLEHAKRELRERGFAQIVVVGARQDVPKTNFLTKQDLSLASTWWTSGL